MTAEARRATKWARNVTWSTRRALKILTHNYGPDIKFASVRIDDAEGWLEIAMFGGLLTQSEAERAKELAEQGRIALFIPNLRQDEGEPSVAET